MRRFSSKPEVQSKKYAVMPLEVKAFGCAPFAESTLSALSPSGMSNILCSRKCATPAGVSCIFPPREQRLCAPP